MDQPNQQPPPPTPPEMPDKEEIRRRRVAKLGSTPASSPSSPSSTPNLDSGPPQSSPLENNGNEKAQQEAESRPKINITRAPKSSEANPFSKLANTVQPVSYDSSGPSSSGTVRNSKKRQATDIDLASAPTSTPARKQMTPKVESIEDFTDNMLSHIFRVSVDSSRTMDTHGHRLLFLPGLSQDLQESGAPLKLSPDVLDSAIVEAATAFPQGKPILHYLLPCWRRVVHAMKILRTPSPERHEALREARRICFSNCIFALTMPELFRYILSDNFLGCSS